jgi:hypothetical protein
MPQSPVLRAEPNSGQAQENELNTNGGEMAEHSLSERCFLKIRQMVSKVRE